MGRVRGSRVGAASAQHTTDRCESPIICEARCVGGLYHFTKKVIFCILGCRRGVRFNGFPFSRLYRVCGAAARRAVAGVARVSRVRVYGSPPESLRFVHRSVGLVRL